MTTKPKQLTLSATGTILLLSLIAGGAFLYIRNDSLRKDFKHIQIASYLYKADELAEMARKRHPKAKIVLNTPDGLIGKKGKDAIYTLTCDLVIGGGVEEDSLETINRPSAVIADKAGNIYVAEYRDGVIKKFSENGDLITAFGGKGQGPGEFSGLLLLAFDHEDNLYVYDFANKRMSRFTNDGTYLSEIMINATNVPGDIKIDGSNHIFLSFYNRRQDKIIHKYAATSELLASFGSPLIFRKKPNFNELSIQNRIASGSIFLADDGLYFSRRNPYEIKKFSYTGKLMMCIYRENDFMRPAEMRIMGKNKYAFPIPPMSMMVCVFNDKIINWVRLPERQFSKTGTIIDLFNLEGRLIKTIELSERIWVKFMDDNGKIYGIRNTKRDSQVVRYALKL